jgi:hypothetical protein
LFLFLFTFLPFAFILPSSICHYFCRPPFLYFILSLLLSSSVLLFLSVFVSLYLHRLSYFSAFCYFSISISAFVYFFLLAYYSSTGLSS